MSFLRRLFGGAAPPQAPAPKTTTMPSRDAQISIDTWTPDHVRGEAGLEVVGEQYYAPNVAAFATLAGGGPGKAILMLQPDNPYDAGAIAVVAYTSLNPPQAAIVGHLSREDAPAYHPFFVAMNGTVLECEAAIAPRRGGRGTDGIVLHVGTPGELIAEHWISHHDALPVHQWSGKLVTFTGFGLTLAGVVLDREGQALLARLAGCEVAPRMSKKVQVCVVHDRNDDTDSLAKARDYGTEIVDEIEFWTGIGIGANELSRGLGRWAQPRGRV